MAQGKKSKEPMWRRTLYLAVSIFRRVDRYAEIRGGISRSVAFGELLSWTIEGKAPISEEMFKLACKEAGFPRFT